MIACLASGDGVDEAVPLGVITFGMPYIKVAGQARRVPFSALLTSTHTGKDMRSSLPPSASLLEQIRQFLRRRVTVHVDMDFGNRLAAHHFARRPQAGRRGVAAVAVRDDCGHHRFVMKADSVQIQSTCSGACVEWVAEASGSDRELTQRVPFSRAFG